MQHAISVTQAKTIAFNQLIRNTYLLLSLTLAVSAVTAGIAMAFRVAPVHWLVVLIFFIGFPFIINMFRNSLASLPLTFFFTGFMGYVLGPILNLYLGLPNGPQTVMLAFGATATIFVGLSVYAIRSRKDFSFMHGFLFTGLIVVLLAIVANIFLQLPVLSLAISAVAVMLMSGLILFDTSRMVHGGETNYVLMTVSLFTNIFVLFIHMLNLFSAFNSSE